jgi:signal transduction histidine kinase
VADTAPPRRPRFAVGVRARTTIAAVVIVGLALSIAAVVLVVFLRGSLTDRVRDAAELRADDVVAALGSGTSIAALDLPADDDGAVQVVDASREVLAASANLGTDRALARPDDGDDARVDGVPLLDIDDDGDDDGDEDEPDADDVERQDLLVVALEASSGGDGVLVLAGRALEPVDESVALTTRAVLVGIPVLLFVVGAVTWFVVGRALAPVERARADVDDISEHDLHRRVAEPPVDDEIGRLVRTLNGLLGRLDESRQRQRRFVSDASHELRSPVASIRNHAEVAVAHPDSTSVDVLARDVLDEDLRLERLVEDLTWMARADERGPGRSAVEVDLDDLVLEESRRAAGTHGVRVDTSALSAGRVHGDPAELRRMVRNLVDNASRHADSLVTVGLAERGGQVVLDVDDDGAGLPESDRARVFERFVRLDEARSRDRGGSGLGLAIVAEIVRRHDGFVVVGDAPGGRGARFEVVLPRR